ncbi:hypothetical protein VCRA2126O85_240020 [Vibrio crassostreae]|nr:hypothetical protein VCRA2128O106_220019 [Vibrio crassostreae]CAK2766443.1 hypothetical protein VCRA2128O100_240018 [Vibrio crassostreae]CAK2770748.1 hypothetical protein VCRA2125O83_220062 [Vibrio crassostreae]CAK2776191.1 hypothetical protein VCRA2127O91_240061 [Vibrio crassostreae]CAK2777193.1 hypothetical protein VCRA2126O85_240020 [Vibrio crassostreae]
MDEFLKDTLDRLGKHGFMAESSGQLINGYRVEHDYIVSPNGTRTQLTKTKPFTLLKWMDDSQKQNFRRIMRKVGKPDMSGYDKDRRELFLLVNGSLVMVKFDDSKTSSSMRQLLYKPVVNTGFHTTFAFKRVTR